MTRALLLSVALVTAAACSSPAPPGAPAMADTEIDWEGPRAFAQGHYEGSPLFARVHRGIAPLVGDARYAHQFGIAVPLLNPDGDGLPTGEEAAQLAVIENALCAALEPGHTSVLVLVITTRGMREFVFYTTDPDQVREAFEELRSTISSHEIQLMIQPDPGWLVYRQFTE